MWLVALLAVHGMIHLLGFAKWSRLASVPQLNGHLLVPLSNLGERLFAVGWFTAFTLLLAAGVLRVARHELWWVVALSGVLLSQGLIAIAWSDAKAGTIANVIILASVAVAAAHASFDRRVDREAGALLREANSDRRVVAAEELRIFPAPVRKWLERSGVVGRPRTATVRLHQLGAIRMKPDAPWMAARAEQYGSVDPPGFVWRVDAEMMRVVPVTGRDRYVGGRGEMLIKAASLVTVVHAADEAIDLGAMLRYLAEIIWVPSAAMERHISWEPIDATHARATMRDAGRAAGGVFTFDEQGRALRFDAERPMGGGNDAKLTPWFGISSEWRRVEGIEVPTRGEVGWQLPTGRFVYYRWEISDVQFNRTDLFHRR